MADKKGPWDEGGQSMERWKREDPDAYKRMRKKFPLKKSKSGAKRAFNWMAKQMGRGKKK